MVVLHRVMCQTLSVVGWWGHLRVEAQNRNGLLTTVLEISAPRPTRRWATFWTSPVTVGILLVGWWVASGDASIRGIGSLPTTCLSSILSIESEYKYEIANRMREKAVLVEDYLML